MNLSLHRFHTAFALIFIALASFGAGFFTAQESAQGHFNAGTQTASTSQATSPEEVDMAAFWRTWEEINERYIGEMPSDEEKVYGAAKGLVNSLDDPYSTFFPPRESEYFKSEISGDFEGVGMEVEIRDGVVTVVAPLKGTPAEKAGVKPGDRVLKIDDTSTEDLTLNEAVDLIRGEKGTVVTLTIAREGESQPIEIDITRDTINIPVFQTRKISEDNAFLITLYNFSAPSADKFREALRQFIELNINQGYNKLILDLRNNPGGYLNAAVDMASWFLPAGEVIVKEDFGDKQEAKVYRSRGYDIFNDNLKMAILVNGGSASASEILAGSLSQHGVATLVGTQTFGKGSVQQLVDITDETSLKITVARWLLPDGSTISEEGVSPDVNVEMDEADIEKGRDTQLERAIEVLENASSTTAKEGAIEETF